MSFAGTRFFLLRGPKHGGYSRICQLRRTGNGDCSSPTVAEGISFCFIAPGEKTIQSPCQELFQEKLLVNAGECKRPPPPRPASGCTINAPQT